MEFDGAMQLPLPRSEAWQKLTDVRFLITCIPDVTEVKEAEENRSVCVITPGFAFVRGKLELTVERLEMEPEQSVRYRMLSKGVGSSSEVESTLTFEDDAGGTKVPWRAEVTKLGGLLKAPPKGLIRGAAQKVITDVWENVAAKLNDLA